MSVLNATTRPTGLMQRLAYSIPRQIVIVRALPGLGDFLCAVPAWRALRKALPQAHISLLGLRGNRDLARRFSCYVDSIIEFPGFPGLIDQPYNALTMPAFLKRMHGLHVDIALQMHGSGQVSNLFTLLLGARHTAGFYLPPHYCPDPELFLVYPQELPEIHRHLALMGFLGIPEQGDELEFPLLETDWNEFKPLAARYDLSPGSYVCIHAGAQDESRRWPTACFAQVADCIVEQGFQVVLTGKATEVGVTTAVARQMSQPSLNLVGQTSLGALALLLERARLLVCNDTGISHLAAAREVRSVVIFTNSEPARWAPLDRTRHQAVGTGIGPVTPAEVLERVTHALQRVEIHASA